MPRIFSYLWPMLVALSLGLAGCSANHATPSTNSLLAQVMANQQQAETALTAHQYMAATAAVKANDKPLQELSTATLAIKKQQAQSAAKVKKIQNSLSFRLGFAELVIAWVVGGILVLLTLMILFCYTGWCSTLAARYSWVATVQTFLKSIWTRIYGLFHKTTAATPVAGTPVAPVTPASPVVAPTVTATPFV